MHFRIINCVILVQKIKKKNVNGDLDDQLNRETSYFEFKFKTISHSTLSIYPKCLKLTPNL